VVGIVLVAHSAKLVEGLRDLVGQLSGGRVPIGIAGGGPRGDLGTDSAKIRAALDAVAGPDGVLVLLDLGSALLHTEAALETLDPATRARVRISDAPLVEGAVVAVVQAGLGQSLAEILVAVEAARHLPKGLA
jgi:dihydroxyacetone kinase phosphotransfer subunit